MVTNNQGHFFLISAQLKFVDMHSGLTVRKVLLRRGNNHIEHSDLTVREALLRRGSDHMELTDVNGSIELAGIREIMMRQRVVVGNEKRGWV